VQIVPTSIREFINFNKQNFPEPPFTMVVRSFASGVTSAGHRLDSNNIELEVVFTPPVEIPPTEGTGSDFGGGTTEEVVG